MAITGGAHAQDAVQWRVEDGGNGHWYAVSQPLPVSWAAWNGAAQSQGAHLLTISVTSEQSFILSTFTGSMLGLRAAPGSMIFTWCNDEQLGFTAWGSSSCASGPYPNNPSGAERFVALRSDPCGVVWDDFQSSELGSPIQVTLEWDADCNSDGVVDFGQIRAGQLIDLNGNNIPDCCEGEAWCQENAVQWRVEDGGNGHWYGWGRVNISDATFLQTRDAAITRGGHLPTVTSAAENIFVFNNIGGGLGLFRPPGGPWQHVTGEPVTFLNWASAAPNGATSTLHFAAYCCHPANTWDDYSDAELGNPLDPYTDFRIEWSADCNSDGIVDFGQIRDGTIADANLNNIPDCCEGGPNCGPCIADVVQDGTVNGVDLAAVINAWGTDGGKLPRADIDGSGLVDGADLAQVLGSWGPCN
jgi:hypothetical protein